MKGAVAVVAKRWRGWLRAFHRDIGYLAVGLTVVYAVSGIAINHLKDWNPNFKTYERSWTVAPIDPALDDDAAIARALEELRVTETPRSVYRAGDEVHVELDGRKLTIIGDQATEQGQQPRFFLRVVNWLHYNRGKKAWTYVADGYAVLLLYLAISGLFMLKGRLGLRWRGSILVALGAAVPIGYVAWSGGPEAAHAAPAKAAPHAEPADDDTPDAPDPPAAGGGEDEEFAPMRPRG